MTLYHPRVTSRGEGLGATVRVGLDVGPVRDRPTGVGVYASSLADALAKAIPGQLVVLGRRPEAPLDGRLSGVAAVPAFRGRNYHEWLHRHADRDARQAGARLVHYTNASAPVAPRLPFIVTIHDLSLLRVPHFHPRLRLVTVPFMLGAVARAQTIIVPSQSTKAELGRVLRVARRRVVVVEHAAPDPTLRPAAAEDVLARYRLEAGSYLLALGTIEPRKNHVRLLAAFERLASTKPDLRLVVAGPAGWHCAPILRRFERSPLRDRVVLTGYVPDEHVAALMSHAALVCYVSLYEGYGLPIVEAMARGTPVVTSRISAMPETAGGAAVLVDPHDVADIARGIERALGQRDVLAAAGRRRVGRRAWSDVAGETVEVYAWTLRRTG
jgi:glycosyltransferase involved in cell wall biosynthesis